MIEGIWHCAYCGMDSTKEGHDGCLGELIGVANACCGHGKSNEAYVQFYDGTAIRGHDAIAIFEILKRNSAPYLDMNPTHEERYAFLRSATRTYFSSRER
jgi:hypothetical protein